MNLPHPIRLAAAPLALAFAFVTGAPAFAHHTDNRTDAFSCKSDNNAGLKRTELVSKLLPATVSVNKVQAETIRTPRRDGSVGDVPTETPQLNGSGVVIDSENGYIVTNYHVVDKEEKLSITLYSKTGRNSRGAAYPVRVVGRDERSDLVVLQVTGKDTPQLPCLPIGDSAAVEAGEEIIAIGTPMALHFSVTSGIVSAVNRRHDTAKGGILNMIQVDTAINPGNSGGLLANMNGEI
ncbi:MAG TPA: trypsin-like peptidase domain-containing protein, partial [Alphaproteobacteria bacterium]